MATNTPNYNLILPGVNDPTDQDLWGGMLNSNFTEIDTLIYDVSQAVADLVGVPVGTPFPVMTHKGAPAPSNSGAAKFIKLTAGDAYNDGLLDNESVTGDAPLVIATAEITVTGSPMDGQTINLWNTENRYPMAGESAGTLDNDQMQQITGQFYGDGSANVGLFRRGGSVEPSGVFSGVTARTRIQAGGSNTASSYESIAFDSADSPDARTGDHTNVKHEQVTYYMRVL